MTNRATTAVLWVLLVTSLVLNALTITFIWRARQVTVDTVYTAKALVDRIQGDTLSYSFPVSQTVPVRAVVPIEQNVAVPLNTTLPIKTTVTVYVTAPVIGTFPLDIPINASVPVSVTFPVHVRQDLNIVTDVPISLTVPIAVPIRDTPLQSYLAEISTGLDQTGRALGGGPGTIQVTLPGTGTPRR